MADLSSRAIKTFLESPEGRRWTRYAAASVGAVLVGQSVIAFLYGSLGWSARGANAAAFVVAGSLSFRLNRSWVWDKRGRSRLRAEILPFWTLACLGLALSSAAVGIGEAIAAGISASRGLATVIVMGGALAATGVVWILKFLVLDRLVFRADAPPA